MNDQVLDYFSNLNPTAKRIIQQHKQLKCFYGTDWDKLDWKQQDELMDDYMVDTGVREKYRNVEKTHSYPCSFPRLVICTGEQIVVDTEKDLWTWQDEHSSPFSWKTKSQQNLTLLDYEPENLLHSSPTKSIKSCSRSTDDNSETFSVTREFEYKEGSIWNSPFLQGVKKPASVSSIYGSPLSVKSHDSPQKASIASKLIENVNYGFKQSVEDIRSNGVNGELLTKNGTALKSNLELKTSKASTSSPKKSVKSPLKSKLLLSPSLSKSSHGESLTSLITESNEAGGQKEKKSAENGKGIDNPADGVWSNFVGEDSFSHTSSSTSSPTHALIQEPEEMKIDRSLLKEGEREEWSRPDTRNKGYKMVHLEVQSEEESAESVEDIDLRAVNSLTDSTDSTRKTGFSFLDDW